MGEEQEGTTPPAVTMLTSAIAKQSQAANAANAATFAKYASILASKRRRSVPFAEFDRWRWTHSPKGARDLPEKKTKIVHPMPEEAPPPDFGFSLEHYREKVAGMCAETLHGHLAHLDTNCKDNTMVTNFGVALLEAQAARADELNAFRIEYSRRNKPWFSEQPARRKAEQAKDVDSDGE